MIKYKKLIAILGVTALGLSSVEGYSADDVPEENEVQESHEYQHKTVNEYKKKWKINEGGNGLDRKIDNSDYQDREDYESEQKMQDEEERRYLDKKYNIDDTDESYEKPKDKIDRNSLDHRRSYLSKPQSRGETSNEGGRKQ